VSEVEDFGRELQLHDPFILPDELELEHEINRPRWWYAQQLRLAGASWDEIAKALGYGSGSSAHTTVKRELTKAEMTKSSAQELMELDLERLDMLQLVVWRQARHGDLRAIDAVLKIMATRAKYLGLDKGASYEDDTSNKATILIGGDSETYLEGIKAAQELHRTPIEGEVAS
jgi:hypothetical protein